VKTKKEKERKEETFLLPLPYTLFGPRGARACFHGRIGEHFFFFPFSPFFSPATTGTPARNKETNAVEGGAKATLLFFFLSSPPPPPLLPFSPVGGDGYQGSQHPPTGLVSKRNPPPKTSRLPFFFFSPLSPLFLYLNQPPVASAGMEEAPRFGQHTFFSPFFFSFPLLPFTLPGQTTSHRTSNSEASIQALFSLFPSPLSFPLGLILFLMQGRGGVTWSQGRRSRRRPR